MKHRNARWLFAVLLALACLVRAQEKTPPTAAVSGIKGVKEEAVAKVKPIEPTVATAPKNTSQGVNKIDGIDTINGVKADGRAPVLPPPLVQPPPPPPATAAGIKGVKEKTAATVKNVEQGVATAPKNTAQGVNKIDGIDTINGVKADGRAPVLPPPPVQPPPPPPPPKAPPVVGVKGTAVNVGGGTVGAGGSIRAVNGVAGINAAKLQNLEVALQIKQNPTPEGPGKAKAAAALLGPGPGTKTGPKADGRAVFQEFEKLPNNGS